ncbi:MAG TPA: DNA-directed RNA polymerase subunit alpha [Candidatus Saccharicenans sp.]|jgi:DNA-directed RNA polymerase subunit alpha|nr:DNA-directed RNA polymerase subunit alpha [Candidatus Saccharicenans sp.]HRD02221.1 DNA-directed RNA polymerase subunit alpha [Candidatus Saccharicenans sp.]
MIELGFQKPRYLECDYETLTDTYGRFKAQPFERGYGITIGNSLRRVLLSSINGAAITAVKIAGVLHEFSSIPGVVEDVTHIILNLKMIPLKMKTNEPKRMTLKIVGPAEVKARDIVHDSDVEILNPDLHIASLDTDGKLEMEMVVRNNRGYLSADENYSDDLSVDFIPLDSSHSPVVRVNYTVEPARVGKKIDYESLTLEVWTNGAIKPGDAVSQAAKILREHLSIFLNIVDEPVLKEAAIPTKEIPYAEMIEVLANSIDHLELSVRANNCLRAAGISYVYELVQKTEEELLRTKNFGRKSLMEIKETLANLGLGLNLELHPKLLEQIQNLIKERKNDKELEA